MASRSVSRMIAGPSCSRMIVHNGRRLPIRMFSSPSASEPSRSNEHEKAPHLHIPSSNESTRTNSLPERPRSHSQSQENGQAQSPSSSPTETTANKKKTAIQYSYFVPRNSNGSVPVYSDFKNQRTRNLTLIRNVEGNVQALKEDIVATLFPDTPDRKVWNQKLRNGIRVHHNRHIVIQGGRWVTHVHKWLLARGF